MTEPPVEVSVDYLFLRYAWPFWGYLPELHVTVVYLTVSDLGLFKSNQCPDRMSSLSKYQDYHDTGEYNLP